MFRSLWLWVGEEDHANSVSVRHSVQFSQKPQTRSLWQIHLSEVLDVQDLHAAIFREMDTFFQLGTVHPQFRIIKEPFASKFQAEIGPGFGGLWVT